VLIPQWLLKRYLSWNVPFFIHVGAHLGEESDFYRGYESASVTWVEANPNLASELKNVVSSRDTVIQAAVWDVSDLDLELNLANNLQASSLLQLGDHSNEHPEIHFTDSIKVRTQRLDSIFTDLPRGTVLNLDIQGAELRALEGLGLLIESVDAVYTEVNFREMYKGCALIQSVDKFLEGHGFKRVLTKRLVHGWGDALYVRNSRITPKLRLVGLLVSAIWLTQQRLLQPAYELLKLSRMPTSR
jgi:FkbM family methyltransferase